MAVMHDPADKDVKESTKKILVAISIVVAVFMLAIIALLVMKRDPAPVAQSEEAATEEAPQSAPAEPRSAPSGGGGGSSGGPSPSAGGSGGGGYNVAQGVAVGFIGPDMAMRRVLCQRLRDEGKPLPPECPQ